MINIMAKPVYTYAQVWFNKIKTAEKQKLKFIHKEIRLPVTHA